VDSEEAHTGALITFDPGSRELVLGLHPDTYMDDANLSAYTRRQLARLGPFLTDDERNFIAMGLQNALVHMIVECDTNEIHCNLLEFLIRTVFVWKFQRHLKEKEGKKVLDREEDNYENLLFDDRTYEEGLTAADFQSQLEKLTMMSMTEVNALLESFQVAYDLNVNREGAGHQISDISIAVSAAGH